MADFQALNSKSKKLFYEKLNGYFGLPEGFKFDSLIFKNSKNKYYLLNNKFIDIMDGGFNFRVLGIYIAEINDFDEIRLNIEGSQLIGDFATKHILELKGDDLERFVRGEDLETISFDPNGELNNQHYLLYFIDKFNKKNYLGCGKVKNGKLFNYTPKSRRVRD